MLILASGILFLGPLLIVPLGLRLLKQAEDNRNRAIDFLGDLVRVQREGEAAVQALVSARLAEIGCTIRTSPTIPSA